MSNSARTALHFDNVALTRLPIDPVKENYIRRVSNALFSLVQPTPVNNPHLAIASNSALELLGLSLDQVMKEGDQFAELFAGNELFDGSQPAAHCYCGHQFGNWAGQLGDGRAISLGEAINDKHGRWEIQLKGAGKTPYSRHADGRAVLRSSIREFLCSEHMHALGVPTTRAATLVVCDDKVLRDPLYDGRAAPETCAIVSRLAPTFFRFGSFEVFCTLNREEGRDVAGPSVGNFVMAKDLLRLILEYHYASLSPAAGADEASLAGACVGMYKEIVHRTAKLVAHWQSVGFTHGVLNTDNMSILGLTIDYGPFGFMDYYDPKFTPNHSDSEGRYRYEAQPMICGWNLARLADALSDAQLATKEALYAILEEEYAATFKKEYLRRLREKFGIYRTEEDGDVELFNRFLQTMQDTAADFTNCFRCLSQVGSTIASSSAIDGPKADSNVLLYLLAQTGTPLDLAKAKGSRFPLETLTFYINLEKQNAAAAAAMVGEDQLKIIKREYERAQAAERYAKMSYQEKEDADYKMWSSWLLDYQTRVERELDGASEAEIKERVERMNRANPKYILRNYLVQRAIAQADKGDFSEVARLLEVMTHPYEEQQIAEARGYGATRPDEDRHFVLSCSS